MTLRRIAAGLLFTLASVSLTAAAMNQAAHAAKTASGNPLLLIGMDGGEWSVIEDLWAQGELQNLKALADRGTRAPLTTQYGQSPVIWTSIATGVVPEVHGISGFVVATDDGDVPVSSTMRKVPAIWNMASAAELKVNVLGWWGAWPAEPVNGTNITEKAQEAQADVVYPPERAAEIKAALPKLNQDHKKLFPGDQNFAPEDRVVTEYGPKLAGEGFDLMVMYLHGSDPNSHRFWRYYRPSDFEQPTSAKDIERYGDKVPKAYRSIDTVIGRVLAASPDDTNIILVSDHGFHPLERPFTKVVLNMDKALAHAGLLVFKADGGVDYSKSKVFTQGTRDTEKDKRLRFNVKGREANGIVSPDELPALKKQVYAELAKFSYLSGLPTFEPSEPKGRDKERGADIVVRVLDQEPTKILRFHGGSELKGAVKSMVENSGGHAGDPPGIFLASGPDINSDANVKGINILDIAPTVLFGLGLPIAEDFAGRPFLELFTTEFQTAHPLRSIPSYGTRDDSEVQRSGDNDAMLDQLRQLGYID